MRIAAIALGASLMASVMASRIIGHHTVANTFDVSHVVTLTGVVTEVEWKMPHVLYHLTVADPSGRFVDWMIESRHVQGMLDNGIGINSIKILDRVSMRVMPALDGSHRAATVSITLADGRDIRVCTVTNNRCPEIR
jgi:hypothetical protein